MFSTCFSQIVRFWRTCYSQKFSGIWLYRWNNTLLVITHSKPRSQELRCLGYRKKDRIPWRDENWTRQPDRVQLSKLTYECKRRSVKCFSVHYSCLTLSQSSEHEWILQVSLGFAAPALHKENEYAWVWGFLSNFLTGITACKRAIHKEYSNILDPHNPHLGLINSTELTQPPLLCLLSLFMDPSPLTVDVPYEGMAPKPELTQFLGQLHPPPGEVLLFDFRILRELLQNLLDLLLEAARLPVHDLRDTEKNQTETFASQIQRYWHWRADSNHSANRYKSASGALIITQGKSR